jgi:hypothetical protein
MDGYQKILSQHCLKHSDLDIGKTNGSSTHDEKMVNSSVEVESPELLYDSNSNGSPVNVPPIRKFVPRRSLLKHNIID